LRPSQVRWSGTIPYKGRHIEIAVIYEDEGIAARLNFHRQTPDANVAATAAEEFVSDKQLAKTLLNRIFTQEVQE
jgi:hypothetical protein